MSTADICDVFTMLMMAIIVGPIVWGMFR